MLVKEKRDKDNIRLVNTSSVLNALRLNDRQMSRPDLAERVGLSKVTIASIIRVLNQKGLTQNAGMGLPDYRGGRKPQLVALNKENKRVVSARISNKRTELLLSDITGRELSRLRSSGSDIARPEEMAAMIRQLADEAGVGLEAIIGLALAVENPESLMGDARRSASSSRHDTPDDNDSENQYAAELSSLLHAPVEIVSLATARAFGERWYNSGIDNPSDFFYLDLDSSLEAITTKSRTHGEKLPGFGSCRLIHPPYGSEKDSGATAESFLGGQTFLKRASDVFGRPVAFTELLSQAEAGDNKSQNLFHEYGYHLGCALSLAINLTSLRRIIIGGFIAEAWPFFSQHLIQALDRNTYPDFRPLVSISPLRQDLNDGLNGALALALDIWVYQTSLLLSANCPE